jgi:AI-2 transport protein TqsA
MTSASATPGVVIAAASFGLVALTIYLLIVGEAILMPLVLAIFIAYLIAALGDRIQRLRIGAWHPPGWLGLTLAITILLSVVALVGQIVAGNISEVVNAAPQYQDRLQDMFTQASAFVATTLKLSEPPTLTTLARQIDLRAVVESFANAFRSIAANTFQVFAYVAFILLEIRTLDRKLKAVLTDPAREKNVRATLNAMGRKIETYVLIKTGISFLNAILTYIILSVVGVDFAGFWALLTFALNFIPYIGSAISTLFPTLLTLLQFGSFLTAGLVLGGLVGTQTFVENVIEPQITGKSLNLSPVVMILSISIWGSIWGITGMILSVPLMVIGMIILAQFPKTRPIAIFMSAKGDIS